MTIGDKVARANLDPSQVMAASFDVGNEAVEAVILTADEGFAPTDENVFGIQELRDHEGNATRLFIKLPRRVMESRHAVVEFYEDHESLIKGMGAVAVLAGVVTAGSLFVKREKQ